MDTASNDDVRGTHPEKFWVPWALPTNHASEEAKKKMKTAIDTAKMTSGGPTPKNLGTVGTPHQPHLSGSEDDYDDDCDDDDDLEQTEDFSNLLLG